MFANRRSSQKPDEDLYAAFKQSFPDVGPGTTSAGQASVPATTAHQRSASISEAIVDPPNQRPFDTVDDANKDMGTTPRPFTDHWRLTPSLMDPNSFAFSAFANQPPGYYTPTPGGFNTFYHSSAAGDLHTPGMGMNTPLSMPHSIHALHASEANAMHFQNFNPHLMHQPPPFHDPFHQQTHETHLQTQQSFAPPSHFLQHQDSGYAAIDDSPNQTTPTQNEMTAMQANVASGPPHLDSGVSVTTHPAGEKFRFHTTLNAPTAMVRQLDEIPITYLNKGQAYTMSIFDTAPPVAQHGGQIRYRTYVRVSFEDEQQRAKPGSCWQLWREGRGSNEAHQRGGKLLAVEYVDPNQGGDDEIRKSQIELEHASFDGFVVNWYPNRINGNPDCAISVRFNFLSTDFSHSKGVKGIPVRLCAKTELLGITTESAGIDPEVCFAKVKLFRDHGAERKLANDIAHVKKSIEKLKQQIAQAEQGMGNVGKRKRSGSMAKGAASHFRRLLKHQRSWSTDSVAEMSRVSAEEDLQLKLINLQDMFSSTRPVSILYLKGEPEDDPDLHPVNLTGSDEIKPLARSQTWESKHSGSDSGGSNPSSPTPSSISLTPKRKFSELQRSVILEEEEEDNEQPGSNKRVKVRPQSPSHPITILKNESTESDLLAIDVDSTYKPPLERAARPVACFYVKDKDASQKYYRAVYLLQRTVKDLINSISEKFQIDATRVTRVTHINAKGLHILVDEDVVRELPEGQDMIVEFAPAKINDVKVSDFATLTEHSTGDNFDHGIDSSITDPLEMWLNY